MLGKDLIISSDYCKWRASLLSVEIKAGLLTAVETLDRVGRVTPLSTSNNDESSGTSGHKNCKGILRQNRVYEGVLQLQSIISTGVYVV